MIDVHVDNDYDFEREFILKDCRRGVIFWLSSWKYSGFSIRIEKELKP